MLKISVPNLNDSFSRVTLDGKQYWIRFTWNDTAQGWSFGLYTIQREPLAVGLRMVPRFPLNLQIVDERFPAGIFGVYTKLESVGRDDFINGKAEFAYILGEQEGAQ
jgi:hypothetical protein